MNKAIILTALLLTGCEQQQQPVHTYTDKEGVVHEVSRETSSSGGGMMEHMAGAAVAGAAAGAAGAAAHRVTDHAINRWQDRKAARRASGRVYHGSVVRGRR